MAKSFVKKGDEVVVIAGSSKGKRGKILLVDPKAERVLVEGVNLRKHHERKSEKNPEGAIVEREASIHISNVMPAGRFDAKKSQKKA
jgi:ribosomal protein L24